MQSRSAKFASSMPIARQHARSIAFVIVVGAASFAAGYYYEFGLQHGSTPSGLEPGGVAHSLHRQPIVLDAIPPARFQRAVSSSVRLKEVIDGDTFTVVSDSNRETVVRLADVDAPTLDQPYGLQARAELQRLTTQASLQISSLGVTLNGMTYARVSADGQDVGTALIRAGAAWVATSSTPEPELITLEGAARNSQSGLWALPARDRIRPCWRRGDC